MYAGFVTAAGDTCIVVQHLTNHEYVNDIYYIRQLNLLAAKNRILRFILFENKSQNGVDYLSPHQSGDIKHPKGVTGRQFSTHSDLVSSRGLIPWLFGGSDYRKIPGRIWGKERDIYNGGRRGHSAGTWLNDLIG